MVNEGLVYGPSVCPYDCDICIRMRLCSPTCPVILRFRPVCRRVNVQAIDSVSSLNFDLSIIFNYALKIYVMFKKTQFMLYRRYYGHGPH
jgi:hypothetical protein